MQGIEHENGCVFYYGNPAGYIDKGIIIMDLMFQTSELEAWLTRNKLPVKWTDGVYDRIMSGSLSINSEDGTPIIKSCRIWQLKPGVAVWNDLVTLGKQLPEPCIKDYAVVFDGCLGTNDLEVIYDMLTEKQHKGFCGYPLSVSDLVELYDDNGSVFYMLDRTHFRKVEAVPQE